MTIDTGYAIEESGEAEGGTAAQRGGRHLRWGKGPAGGHAKHPFDSLLAQAETQSDTTSTSTQTQTLSQPQSRDIRHVARPRRRVH